MDISLEQITFLDLEKNTNLTPEEILFFEINKSIEQVNYLLNNIEFDLAKNLDQHLIKFKEENNLDNLSEEEKIFEFIKFVDKEELNYFNQVKASLINNIEKLNDSISIITTKSMSIKQSLESQKKINESKGIFFKIKNIFKDSETKNLDIYKFKYNNLRNVFAELYLLKDNINRIKITTNNIDFNKLILLIQKNNNLYTLDTFVKENPLFKNKFNYLDIKPYNFELKEIIKKSKIEIENIEKDLDINVSKKLDLLSKRITINQFHHVLTQSLNKAVLKPLCILKENLSKMPKSEDLQKIVVGAMVLVMSSQISGMGDVLNKDNNFKNSVQMKQIMHYEKLNNFNKNQLDI